APLLVVRRPLSQQRSGTAVAQHLPDPGRLVAQGAEDVVAEGIGERLRRLLPHPLVRGGEVADRPFPILRKSRKRIGSGCGGGGLPPSTTPAPRATPRRCRSRSLGFGRFHRGGGRLRGRSLGGHLLRLSRQDGRN